MSRTYRERYPAIVADVDDPETRGRVKIRSRSLMANDETYPFWVEPAFPLAGNGYGWFFIPAVDDIVEIELVTGSDNDPVSGMSGMHNPQPRWRCCDYADGVNLPEEFRKKGKYGKRMGIRMPSGQILMFDEGVTELVLKYGKLRLGSETASEPLVLGLIHQACLSAFMQAFLDHYHSGWFGNTTTPDAASAAVVAAKKASPVGDGAMLSDTAFVSKTSL